MKKFLSLCLTALMLLSVLTGCGGTADTAEPDGGADAGAETVPDRLERPLPSPAPAQS